MDARILILVKDSGVSGLLNANLNMFGYQTVCAATERQARKAMRAQRFDLALCDLTWPEQDAAALLALLKAQGIPVIPVSDQPRPLPQAWQPLSLRDAIKPANIRELLSRIEALLRREDLPALTYRDIAVTEQTQTVKQNGVEIQLKPMEYALLLTFLRQEGKTLTREELLRQVWGDASGVATRTVDVHVAALRRKLNLTKALTTVYKTGYRLEKE